jgi:hypothetical protein
LTLQLSTGTDRGTEGLAQTSLLGLQSGPLLTDPKACLIELAFSDCDAGLLLLKKQLGDGPLRGQAAESLNLPILETGTSKRLVDPTAGRRALSCHQPMDGSGLGLQIGELLSSLVKLLL